MTLILKFIRKRLRLWKPFEGPCNVPVVGRLTLFKFEWIPVDRQRYRESAGMYSELHQLAPEFWFKGPDLPDCFSCGCQMRPFGEVFKCVNCGTLSSEI